MDVLCHGDPAALNMQIRAGHMVLQFIDEEYVRVG